MSNSYSGERERESRVTEESVGDQAERDLSTLYIPITYNVKAKACEYLIPTSQKRKLGHEQ